MLKIYSKYESIKMKKKIKLVLNSFNNYHNFILFTKTIFLIFLF